MVKLLIRCPSCHKSGIIEIDENVLKNVSRGLLAIYVDTHTVCEHSFITYVDRNLKIRDYFIADFQFEIARLGNGFRGLVFV